MGANLFLSYAHSDHVLAGQVAQRLAADEDGRFHMIERDGAPFEDALRAKIVDSDAILVVMSRRSLESGAAMAEFGAALMLDKPIFVIHPDPDPLPFSLPSRVRIVEAAGLSPDQIAATVRARLAA